jgi:phosphoribosyl 1,2-cyclic phosphodiesterase
VRIRIWGSRGSIASAGPETRRYGGNTACVEIEADHDEVLILDAGTGIRQAGEAHAGNGRPVHVLLTHLHMDHIQGLGFFGPLFEPGREVHIWGPPSTTMPLRARLTRYLSPPLFPVRLIDLGSSVALHDLPAEPWRIGSVTVGAASVIHPGPTVGYRITGSRGGARATMAYLPDHEPAIGGFRGPDWTSGRDLARDVDLLLHDAQYTAAEYNARIGWGHSSIDHAVTLADLANAERLVLIHHEPGHSDDQIDLLLTEATDARRRGHVIAAADGMTLDVHAERSAGA